MMTSKSNKIISAGGMIRIKKKKENKVLINSTILRLKLPRLKFTVLQYNKVEIMTIEKKIIKINRNHDNRLIKLKYSTILEIILEPIKLKIK